MLSINMESLIYELYILHLIKCQLTNMFSHLNSNYYITANELLINLEHDILIDLINEIPDLDIIV